MVLFNASNLITLGLALISASIGYGMLNQRVKSLEKQICEIDGLREEIKKTNEALNQLLGEFKMFFNMMQQNKGD